MESLSERVPGKIYVVTTAPPGPLSEFVELEDHEGRGLGIGRWVELPGSLPSSPLRYALELDDPRGEGALGPTPPRATPRPPTPAPPPLPSGPDCGGW